MKTLNTSHEYLVIRSTGEIDVKSFLIMGGSTKRGDASKIGRFGSGLKYAIASLLKKENNFIVYSGLERVEFETHREVFRDQEFDIISVNGEKTNFSTDMGPDWDYFSIVRDIYSNAVDEGIIDFRTTSDTTPKLDQTHFYIEITEDMMDMLENIHLYFSDFRTDCILEKDGKKVYTSPGHLVVYKSGFKVLEDKDKPSIFNYDFDDLEINESRNLKSYYSFQWDCARFLLKNANEKITSMMLEYSNQIPDTGETRVFEFNIDWDVYASDLSKEWEKAFKEKQIVTREATRFYSENDVDFHYERRSVVPHSLGKRFSSFTPVSGISSSFKPHDYIEVDMNSNDLENLLLLSELCLRLDIEKDFDIKKVKFGNSSINISYVKGIKSYILISEDKWSDRMELCAMFMKALPTYLDKEISLDSKAASTEAIKLLLQNTVFNTLRRKINLT